MKLRQILSGMALVAAAVWSDPRAYASLLVPPANLVHELLSETIPTAVSPFEADAFRDFSVHWETPAPEGLEISLVEGSLQWVRVSEILVLPRARILIKGAKDGVVSQGGYATPASKDGEMAVALLSNPAYAVEIKIRGKTYRVRLIYRGINKGWWTDTSCSSVQLEALPAPEGWGYVGCRRVASLGKNAKRPSLQTWWVWNSSNPKNDAEFKVDGERVEPISPGLWGVRFEPDRREARIGVSGTESLARVHLGPTLNFGMLGVGVGPYVYRFSGFGEDVNRIVPLLTLYGAYTITDTIRITAFSATAVAPQWYTDVGLYLSTESFAVLDRRLSVRLMLGAHLIGFKTTEGYVGRFGAPQGFEAVYYDAFVRGRNLGLGGFLYPEIDGKSYYNLWIRWGSARFFGELNYISWKEAFEGGHPYFSRSVGLTFGFPVAGFL